MIGRNFLWLSATQVIGLGVGLLSSIYAWRVLGVLAIGEYAWCLSVLSYFSLLANPGVETIAKRDVAREPGQAARWFSLVLALRFGLALVALGLVGAFAVAGLRRPEIGHLLLLMAIGLLFGPFDLTWLLQACERMASPAIAQIVSQVLRLAALTLLVHEPAHLSRYVLLAYPLQLGLIGYLGWYANHHGLLRWTEVRPSLRGAWPLFLAALPFGLSQGAVLLYYNSDAILLGVLSGDRAVGIYTTAYSVMLVPTFLSGALTSAYFPQLSRIHENERQAATISADFLRILVWMGMPLAALGWAFGRYAVVLVYGHAFAESGPLLEWLSLNLALIFFSIGVGQPLTAWGLQRQHFRITLSGAVVNVALNLILIPRLGIWGAMITTLLAESVVGIACLRVRNRNIRLPWWEIVARPLFVCLAAALVGRSLASAFPAQWMVSLILIACGIAAAFWASERNGLPALLRRLRAAPELTGP